MKIKQIGNFYKLLDLLLTPFMFLVGGLKTDSIQQTHQYHICNLETKIDLAKSVKIIGFDLSKFNNKGNFFTNYGLFHMPIIGGWKNYVVLENTDFVSLWYVGWFNGNKPCLHKKPIKKGLVKVLSGKKGSETIFFGIDKLGTQVSLQIADTGVLGDMKYKKIPLY